MKHSSKKQKPSVLLLDFASEKNRGDAAMQVSTVQLAKKYFPEATFSVLTVFGVNQYPESLSQFDHTYPDEQLRFIGGLYPTCEVFAKGRDISRLRRRIFKFRALIQSVFFVSLLALRLPRFVCRYFLSAEARKSFDAIVESDFIIWNGRNIRSHSAAKEPHDVFVLLFHPLIAVLCRKPMVCLGTSVWELKNTLARTLVEYVFARCRFVSAREHSTYSYLCTLLQSRAHAPRILELPDLSLYMLRSHAESRDQLPHRPHIGLTIVGEREIGDPNILEAYVTQMHALVTRLRDDLDADFVVVPQVTFVPEENDTTVVRIFEGVESKRYTIGTKDMSVSELVAQYADLDFLCATRMHSAIFALSTGTPVLAIAYDAGAKWNILTDMGLPDQARMSAADLLHTDLVARFCDVWKNRKEQMTAVRERLEQVVYPAVEEHMSVARTVYDEL